MADDFRSEMIEIVCGAFPPPPRMTRHLPRMTVEEKTSVLEVRHLGQGHDADAGGFQALAHRLGARDGRRTIAMHADRIDLAGDALARGRVDRLLVDHAPHMG